MADKNFEPIRLNAKAPGGERVLKSFDDIGAFILMRVEMRFRELPWWQAVLKDLPQARFGARQKETRAAMRAALAEEGWLADPAPKLPAKSPVELKEAALENGGLGDENGGKPFTADLLRTRRLRRGRNAVQAAIGASPADEGRCRSDARYRSRRHRT